MKDITSRPYTADDFAACLSIFDSNVPTFFAQKERAEFCEYLESVNAKDRPYLVLAREGSVIACGGLIVEPETEQARLAWGMVARPLHGQGLGTRLTQARLSLAHANPNISEVGLTTSQHTRAFYERFGFSASKITPDGLAPGLDRWDMTLHLA